jgi:hypothetical protein
LSSEFLPFQEILKITTEVADSGGALEELGYVGGNVDSMDDTANLLLDLEEYVGLLVQNSGTY